MGVDKMISLNTVQALKNIGKIITVAAVIGMIVSVFVDNDLILAVSLGALALYCLITLPVWLNK